MSARTTPTSRLWAIARWVDARGRSPGTWAYVANRVTGVALVGYLYIHLAVLSLLARGPESYDRFVNLMRSPLFLVLDVVLIAAMLVHGLNGVRLTLLGLGVGVRSQRTMLIVAGIVAVAVLLVATVLLFGG